ncbi:hypothetical protein JQN58_12730 [Aneurinibacillus sp. BA2021]|nr:hypothetical protein [Aneurinibacillus sp. BA2021]
MNSAMQQFEVYGVIMQKEEVRFSTDRKGNPVAMLSFLIQNETSILQILMRGHQFQHIFIRYDDQIRRVPYSRWRDGQVVKGTIINGRCFPDFEAVHIVERQIYRGMTVRVAGNIEVIDANRLRYIAKEISLISEIPATASNFSMTIQVGRLYENRGSARFPCAVTVEGKVIGQSQGMTSLFYTCDEKTASVLTVGEPFRVTGKIIRSPWYEQIEGERFFSGIHNELRIMNATPFSPVHA